jgi:hypothetical protein
MAPPGLDPVKHRHRGGVHPPLGRRALKFRYSAAYDECHWQGPTFSPWAASQARVGKNDATGGRGDETSVGRCKIMALTATGLRDDPGLLCATACRSVADMERRHPAGHVARHERALSPGLTDASSLLLAPQIPW